MTPAFIRHGDIAPGAGPTDQTHQTGPDRGNGIDRRHFLSVFGGGLAALAVAGCTNASLKESGGSAPAPAADTGPRSTASGSRASGSTASSPVSGSESSGAGDGADPAAAFPVTVTHRFGTTTIPAEPQRILALGQTDCDPLIALGITPIAIGSFAESWYDPVHPWNEAGFGGERPQELNFFEVPFEKVAALKPDLITMISGGITEADYKTLSAIAPVVGAPEGYQDSAVPYGPHTVLIGQCVGREAEATKLVEDLDARYAAAREEHPEWASLTAAHAECYSSAFDVLGVNAPRTTFLTSLGFTLSPELAKITDTDYMAEISAEQLNLLDGLDLVIWCTDPGAVPELQKNPVVSRLGAVRDGTTIWISGAKTDQFMWAMDWNTVLSGSYALDKGVPLVEAALAGKSPVSDGA